MGYRAHPQPDGGNIFESDTPAVGGRPTAIIAKGAGT
jgi:hypothetical protein